MTLVRALPCTACLLITAFGCAGGTQFNSVIAHADETQASESYEVAMATAEAQGYRIAAKDPKSFYVRVWAKPTGMAASSVGYLDLQATAGAVEISLPELPDRAWTKAERRELYRQMQQLGWDIQNRAAILRGRPLGPAVPASPDPLPKPFVP
jgi:hypothetical protein